MQLDSEFTKQENPNFRNGFSKRSLLIISAILFSIIMFAGGFIFGSKQSISSNSPLPPSKILDSKNTQSNPSPKIIDEVSASLGPRLDSIRTYPSVDRNATFYIYPSAEPDKCFYGVRNGGGIEKDLSRVLGTDTLPCDHSQGLLDTPFHGWVDENKFLLAEEEGVVTIIDTNNFSKEIYSFDAKQYHFIGASNSLTHWLFKRVGSDASIQYVLLDGEKNVVLDGIEADSDTRPLLRDDVNDGFVFISRFYDENNNTKSVFSYLSFSDLTFKELLSTEPIETIGRGCYSEYLISKPGEIILTPGCYTVPEKYYSADGNLHFLL